LKNILRRKFRTVLTTIGVAVAIAAVVGLLSITKGYERSSKAAYSLRGIDMVVSRAGVANRATSTLDESIAKRIAEISGVDRIEKSLWDNVKVEGQSVRLSGWPIDSFAFNTIKVDTGRQFEPQDIKSVMLGATLASDLQKKVGEEVTIESTPFK